MAAIAAGIFNHAMTRAQDVTKTNTTPMPEATGADGASSTSTSSATISANDFLTLLVTEMKNQDPTANTDPNEYINQLVNVNSLEQLIDINQNLSKALGNPGSNSSVSTGQLPAVSNAQVSPAIRQSSVPLAGHPDLSNPAAGGNLSTLTAALKHAPGNLTVPDANPAAHSVASALGGRPHTSSIPNGLR